MKINTRSTRSASEGSAASASLTRLASGTSSLLQRKPLIVNPPGDRYEQEADRVADAVMRGHAAPFSLSRLHISRVQRDDVPKDKTIEEKYKTAAGKLGEAFLATPLGKELVEKVKQDRLVTGITKAGKSFISTLPGKFITGAAATGAVTALAATHQELPAQIPEIPLDMLTPGLSVEITYTGPVDKPNEAMITFKFTEQAPRDKGDKKTTLTESERYRAETARIAADQAKFRAGLMYPPGSREDLQQKAEAAAIRNNLAKYASGPDIDAMIKKYPWLAAQLPKGNLQITPPVPTFGFRPLSLLSDDYQLNLPGSKNKKHELMLQRQAARDAAVDIAPPEIQETLSRTGQPMDAKTRSLMEQGFGQDFSRVRIHHDARAADSARSIDAKAYTVGHDVVFGSGHYSPTNLEGRRLLAHELTHVLQQEGSSEWIPAVWRVARITLPYLHDIQAYPVAQVVQRQGPRGKSSTTPPPPWTPPTNVNDLEQQVNQDMDNDPGKNTSVWLARAAIIKESSSLKDEDKGEYLKVIAVRFSKAEKNAEVFQVLSQIKSLNSPKPTPWVGTALELSAGNTQDTARMAMGLFREFIKYADLQPISVHPPAQGKPVNPLTWFQQNTRKIGEAIKKLADTGQISLETSIKLTSLVTRSVLANDSDYQSVIDQAGNILKLRDSKSDPADQYNKKQADCDVYARYITRLLEAQGWQVVGYFAFLGPQGSVAHAIGLARRPRPASARGFEYIVADNLQFHDMKLLDSPGAQIIDDQAATARAASLHAHVYSDIFFRPGSFSPEFMKSPSAPYKYSPP